MRDRLLEFLPLLLALSLIALWFGLQPPVSWPFALPGPEAASPAARTLPLATSTPPPTLSRAAAIQSLCDPKQPQFLGSLASLKTRLGTTMGTPASCERAINADGDTEQQTSTGLAYYRHERNLAAFTTGWDHWALDGNKLLQWQGPDIEPPQDAATVP
jgi:hypothetical protein